MATILLTSNYRPEYRRAGIIACDAQAGSVMVFSYQPQHIAPDVSLCVDDEVDIHMQRVDEPEQTFYVRTGHIIGLVYTKDRIYITLKFLNENLLNYFDVDGMNENVPIDGRGYYVYSANGE